MKKTLLATLLLVFAASCNKQDVGPKSPLPPPSCDDRSDDGKFEVWTIEQMKWMQFDTIPRAMQESKGGLGEFWMSKTSFKNEEPVKVYYTQDRTIALQWWINYPNGEYQNGMDLLRYERMDSSGKVNDSIVVLIPPGQARGAGCGRLYYMFKRDDTSTISIITQGHFDLNFE